MNLLRLALNPFKSFFYDRRDDAWHDTSRCQFNDNEGNEFIYNQIHTALSNNQGLCIAKFGTVELSNLLSFMADSHPIKYPNEIWNYLRGYQSLFPVDTFPSLCQNAGFFPNDITLGKQWLKLVLEDLPQIDILGSYQRAERCLGSRLGHCRLTPLKSYLAPYCFANPWTQILSNHRILVIHPFEQSIRHQYQRRTYLFDNPAVLPTFKELLTLRAVQSIAGTPTPFNNWFEALDDMKRKMSAIDYDIAIVGCGAYGMHLAVHAKRMGKVGVHMAGWTQMLFGIYGNRWLNDEPEFKHFINPYWIRPSSEETPTNAALIENSCYW